jgi:hypothetical protein
MARNQQKIEQVLQTCLDLIESGQETVESVLARYPEFADQLKAEIALWLSTQKDTLNPRPGWVAASKRQVMALPGRNQDRGPTHRLAGLDPAWLSRLTKAVQVTLLWSYCYRCWLAAMAWSWPLGIFTGRQALSRKTALEK